MASDKTQTPFKCKNVDNILMDFCMLKLKAEALRAPRNWNNCLFITFQNVQMSFVEFPRLNLLSFYLLLKGTVAE